MSGEWEGGEYDARECGRQAADLATKIETLLADYDYRVALVALSALTAVTLEGMSARERPMVVKRIILSLRELVKGFTGGDLEHGHVRIH